MAIKQAKLIIIAGNIGSGKTTLSRRLAETLNWECSYESVDENPYLTDFYGDMRRWAFHLQAYFLVQRKREYRRLLSNNKAVIIDRSIAEDRYVFARVLHKQGKISKRDYTTYCQLYEEMTGDLPQPDLLIYLQGSVSTLRHRIASRNRGIEQNIEEKYLRQLNNAYEKWIETIHKENSFPLMTVDINKVDIATDLFVFNEILQRLADLNTKTPH
jgi:deoxyadenosine/deoxycytidine kinase